MHKNQFVMEKLKDYFSINNRNTKNSLNELALYIYSVENSDSDLYYLAKLLDDDSLEKLISYFDGASIKMPRKDDFISSFLLSICFYLIEFKGIPWTEIKKSFNFSQLDSNFNSVSIGKKIARVKKNINKELLSLLNSLKQQEVENVLKEVTESEG